MTGIGCFETRVACDSPMSPKRPASAGDGYATGAAAADYDNDGHVDLFVAGVQRNQLLHNTGDGRFQDVTARAGIKNYKWSVAAGWFDYDNDGWLDLFIVNYVDWTPQTTSSAATARKNLRVYCHPEALRRAGQRTVPEPSRRNVRRCDASVPGSASISGRA